MKLRRDINDIAPSNGRCAEALTINGIAATEGQAMTLRVAVQTFLMSLAETGCGNDEHGRRMTANYQRLCGEINDLMRIDAQKMSEALREIGKYTGEGGPATPWREIVRDCGETARRALGGGT